MPGAAVAKKLICAGTADGRMEGRIDDERIDDWPATGGVPPSENTPMCPSDGGPLSGEERTEAKEGGIGSEASVPFDRAEPAEASEAAPTADIEMVPAPPTAEAKGGGRSTSCVVGFAVCVIVS